MDKAKAYHSPYHHVYERIATRVHAQFGERADTIGPFEVQDVVEDHARRPMADDIEAFIRNEAREYGIEVTG